MAITISLHDSTGGTNNLENSPTKFKSKLHYTILMMEIYYILVNMLLSLELKSLVSKHKEKIEEYQKQILDLKEGKTKFFLINCIIYKLYILHRYNIV